MNREQIIFKIWINLLQSEQQIEKKNIFKSFNTKIVSLVSEKQWRLSKNASEERDASRKTFATFTCLCFNHPSLHQTSTKKISKDSNKEYMS